MGRIVCKRREVFIIILKKQGCAEETVVDALIRMLGVADMRIIQSLAKGKGMEL